MDSTTLAIIIAAKDEASVALGKMGAQLDALGGQAEVANAKSVNLGKQFDSLASNAGKLGSTMTMGVTLPIVGAAAAGVDLAVKFNQSMTYVRTDAGDTTDSMNKLSNQVLELAKNSQFSPDQLANGLYHVASLGLRGADAINALTVAQNMAAVGGADLESTTTALGGAIVTGIKGVQDYSQAAGTLDATVGAGNMRMQDLVNAIGTGVLPVFKNAGLSITDFGAALATLTDNGQAADAAATHLRMTVSLMEAPSQAAQKQMAAIGLTSTQLGMDMQTKGLVPALQDLRKHLIDTYGTTAEGKEKMAAALTEMFGGGRSSAAIQTLLDQIDRVQNKESQISQQSGEFASKVAEQQQTASAKIKTAWDAIQANAIQLGSAVLPTLATALKDIVGAITGVFNWFEKLSPSMQRTVGILIAVAAAFGPLLLGISKGIKMFQEFYAVFKVIGGGSALLGGGIFTAIILLAALAALIITHWSTVKRWFDDFWGWMKKAFSDVVNFIKAHWQLIIEIILGPIGIIVVQVIRHWKLIEQGFQALVNFFKPAVHVLIDIFKIFFDVLKFEWQLLVAIVEAVWGIIYKAIIKPYLDIMKAEIHALIDVFTVVWNIIVDIFKETWKAIVWVFKFNWDVIKSVWSAAVGFFQGIWNDISSPVKGIIDVITGMFSGMWDTIKGGFKTGINTLIDLLNNTFVRVYNDTIGKIPKAPKIPEIPKLAMGTSFFGGGVALVGENGPELVDMPSGSRVTPAAQTKQAMSSGMGDVHVHIHAGAMMGTPHEAQAFATTVYQSLQQIARRNGKAGNMPDLSIRPA